MPLSARRVRPRGGAAAAIDRVLDDAVAAGAVPGVVAAVSDAAATFYASAFGRARPAAGIELDSVFRIASMTKLVTTLAIMMLNEDGKLSLEQPLAELLPGYRQPGVLTAFDPGTGAFRTRPAAGPVTVRQLLTHTSGYGYWFLSPPLARLKTGAPELFNPPFLLCEPGEAFNYGISSDVLGQVVEPLSGLSLDRFFAKRIFGPLDMHATGFDPPADPDRLVTAHARGDGGFSEWPRETHGEAPHGGGGMYSCVEDYLKLLRLMLNRGTVARRALLAGDAIEAITCDQLDGSAVPPQTTSAPDYSNDFVFIDGTQRFGFGVLIETVDRPGGRRAGSYGWGGIWNTYYWVDPHSGIAAVLMMQLSPFADPQCLALYRRFEQAVYQAIEPPV